MATTSEGYDPFKGACPLPKLEPATPEEYLLRWINETNNKLVTVGHQEFRVELNDVVKQLGKLELHLMHVTAGRGAWNEKRSVMRLSQIDLNSDHIVDIAAVCKQFFDKGRTVGAREQQEKIKSILGIERCNHGVQF